MSLRDIIRNGVAIANNVTSSLQAAVTLKRWTGEDDYGAPSYEATPLSLTAIVEYKQRMIVNPGTGQSGMARARVLILEPIPSQGAADRNEPIDNRDILTLPDGTTSPIIDVNGVVDAGTNEVYFAEIWVGLQATA